MEQIRFDLSYNKLRPRVLFIQNIYTEFKQIIFKYMTVHTYF